MKKNYVRNLLIILIFIILAGGLYIGITEFLSLAEENYFKEDYIVEDYPIDSMDYDWELPRYVTENEIFSAGISANSASGNSLSGNFVTVSENCSDCFPSTVSENEQPEFKSVDDSYFSDAVFIGDSRTVGLYEYGGMDQATFYASEGLTVYKVFDAKIVPVPGSREKITVKEALQKKQFGKIYFMIGINEMGRGTVDTFMEEYQKVVEEFQRLQPNAVIYVQSIMKVSETRDEKRDYINNRGIEERNSRIAQLAIQNHIFYLDVNPLICDEKGYLKKAYTSDGVHLKAEYIPIWKDYLMSHAIVK